MNGSEKQDSRSSNLLTSNEFLDNSELRKRISILFALLDRWDKVKKRSITKSDRKRHTAQIEANCEHVMVRRPRDSSKEKV